MNTSYEKLLNQYKEEIQNLTLPPAGFPKFLFHLRTKSQIEKIRDLQSERTSNCRSAHEAAIAISIVMQTPLNQPKTDFKAAISKAARRKDE